MENQTTTVDGELKYTDLSAENVAVKMLAVYTDLFNSKVTKSAMVPEEKLSVVMCMADVLTKVNRKVIMKLAGGGTSPSWIVDEDGLDGLCERMVEQMLTD